MGVRIKNDKFTGTGEASFTVPSGKSWMVKVATVEVIGTGTSGVMQVEVDGVNVTETPNPIGASLVLVHLIGADHGGNDPIPKQVFLEAGQVLKFANSENHNHTIHFSYVERDVPT